MKIEIELTTETCSPGWKVTLGGKYAHHLCYEEMLGLVASLTMPDPKPCLQWMKTKEAHFIFDNN